MYGFRGQEHNVDLLSAFEMLRFWSVRRVETPTAKKPNDTAELTEAGQELLQEHPRSRLRPGEHYVALAAENRVLLPDLPV